MIASIATVVAGILISLFIFWKRLKDDYSSEIIFKTAVNIAIGILLAWLLSIKLLPGGFLWFEFLGTLTGLGVSAYIHKIRFYETFEAFIISMLPSLSFLFLKDSVVRSSLVSFIAFLVILILIFVYYYLDIHYKRFAWYKSGKIGFSGLAVITLIFIIRSGLAAVGITVLSFLGVYEVYLSGVGAVITLFLLVNLGRQKI